MAWRLLVASILVLADLQGSAAAASSPRAIGSWGVITLSDGPANSTLEIVAILGDTVGLAFRCRWHRSLILLNVYDKSRLELGKTYDLRLLVDGKEVVAGSATTVFADTIAVSNPMLDVNAILDARQLAVSIRRDNNEILEATFSPIKTREAFASFLQACPSTAR